MKSRELLANLLEASKNRRSTAQLHSQVLKNGFAQDSFLVTKLVSKYSSVENARKLFDEMDQRTVYLWNALLRSHCREKHWDETLCIFHDMVSISSRTREELPDNFTVSIALKACAELSKLKTGKEIHGFVKKNDKMRLDMFVGAALIELYAKCGEMGDALQVFKGFSQPDVVLWTSMVTGYQKNGNLVEALDFFSEMVRNGSVSPDPVTLVSVVAACVQLEILDYGKSVHGFTIRKGFDSDMSLVNSLLNLYTKTGSLNNTQNLFETMLEKDMISWSSMISCYVKNDMIIEALKLFNEMAENGLEPNSVIVISALQACGLARNIHEGRRIHELARQKKFELEVSVSTALIDMYMKCLCIEEAIDLFERMPKRDVVSWAALINGYALNGLAIKSLGVFHNMLLSGTRPDAVTMVKVLDSCSELGSLQQALCLHGYLVIGGFDGNVFVVAALIDLYSKCGSLDNSIRVFQGMNKKDVFVWSSMIASYGIHGLCEESIQTFNEMIKTPPIIPNRVTFLSLLSSCSHAGKVEEGINIFNKMMHDYHIEPNTEHYSVMVDLLGRTGKLQEAMEFIKQMPISPGPHVWGALLGACRIHQNVEMGEEVAEKLLKLDPDHAGYYLLLSNIYVEDEKWDDATKIRSLMKVKMLKRMAGMSEYICHG